MSEISKIEAIEFLLKQFKPERFAYITVTIASFILLLICVIFFISTNQMSSENLSYVSGIIGSGGAIAYTASQLLSMWKDCVSLLSDVKNNKNEEKQ
jgi:hypothetical protein